MLYVVASVYLCSKCARAFIYSRFCFNDTIFRIIRKFGFYKKNYFKIYNHKLFDILFIIIFLFLLFPIILYFIFNILINKLSFL